MMKLHNYQTNCLCELTEFFVRTEEEGVKIAFVRTAERPYVPVDKLRESMPVVCIRIPTGGGKTLMAAHALVIAAKKHTFTETPLCLWLAPSGAIVEQTLNALQNPRHPYRQVLDASFPQVNILSITDALRIGKAELDSAANVIVSTVQSLRQERTEGRKIYGDNGALMEHFENLSEEQCAKLEEGEDGVFHQSLANALSLHKPIIIMDEAHNARTPLSFESFARFNPSCILEFTATPKTGKKSRNDKNAPSNILCQVSARELKQAGMIKMPIQLHTFASWPETINSAIEKRKLLEEQARSSGIRPIVLYQAENLRGEANVEAVQAALKKTGIPENQIAVVTGSKRELKNIDLFAPDCQIRHIITVLALAEGWDCSFAYVLCALSNIATPQAVEQILGRVLRMPFSQRSENEALNCAYAFTVSDNFHNTARNLKDSLVEHAGFENIEAEAFVQGASSVPLWQDSSTGAGGGRDEKLREIKIPLLAVLHGEQLEILEAPHFLSEQWDFSQMEVPTNLNLPEEKMGKGTLDMNVRGKIAIQEEEAVPYFSLSFPAMTWGKEELVAWLDRKIPHLDIPQADFLPFIRKAVDKLVDKYEWQRIDRHRVRVANAIEQKMQEHRYKKRKAGIQETIKESVLPDGRQVSVTPGLVLVINEQRYAPNSYYQGGKKFKKHFFQEVGELADSGEEFDCACYLDSMEAVEFWIRNLAKKLETSFWLPISEGRFYPDFIAKLKDGRFLVVEYKGEHLWADAQEKRDVGRLWQNHSNSKCLFFMTKGKNLAEIDNLIAESNMKRKR